MHKHTLNVEWELKAKDFSKSTVLWNYLDNKCIITKLPQIVAVKRSWAFSWTRHTGEHIEKSRLASSIVSQDGRNLPFVNVQAQSFVNDVYIRQFRKKQSVRIAQPWTALTGALPNGWNVFDSPRTIKASHPFIESDTSSMSSFRDKIYSLRKLYWARYFTLFRFSPS